MCIAIEYADLLHAMDRRPEFSGRERVRDKCARHLVSAEGPVDADDADGGYSKGFPIRASPRLIYGADTGRSDGWGTSHRLAPEALEGELHILYVAAVIVVTVSL